MRVHPFEPVERVVISTEGLKLRRVGRPVREWKGRRLSIANQRRFLAQFCLRTAPHRFPMIERIGFEGRGAVVNVGHGVRICMCKCLFVRVRVLYMHAR